MAANPSSKRESMYSTSDLMFHAIAIRGSTLNARSTAINVLSSCRRLRCFIALLHQISPSVTSIHHRTDLVRAPEDTGSLPQESQWHLCSTAGLDVLRGLAASFPTYLQSITSPAVS